MTDESKQQVPRSGNDNRKSEAANSRPSGPPRGKTQANTGKKRTPAGRDQSAREVRGSAKQGTTGRGPGTSTRAQGGRGLKPGSPAGVGPGFREQDGAAVSPARAAAFELLERIRASSAHSDDLLHGPRLAGLSQVDKDLTMALVLGVLRWEIALDGRIRPLLSRPDWHVPEPVAIALRMGAFQLLHLERIPAHAALNESVELVRAAGQPQAAGMVNAVLRKLVGAGPQRKPLVESLPAMAERLGHPLWLAERWAARYGRQAAEAICGFDQQEPACAPIFDEVVRAPVMDAGSRLIAELAAAARPEARRVWDCCAAPGGKAVVLAERLPGAELLATDVSPVRLKRLGQRLKWDLPGREVRLEMADAAALPEQFGEFDLVLCDVPCSGTGTLARNPEIRHRLRLEDLRRQAERQRRILTAALGRLAPGGLLVYSTCSLEPEECDEVVAAVTGSIAVRRVDVRGVLDGMAERGLLRGAAEERSGWVRDGVLRTLPGFGFPGDGFFGVLLERM